MSHSRRFLFAAILVLAILECADAQTQPPSSAETTSSGAGVVHVGGGVTTPQATYAPKAEYSEEARREKFEGICVVLLIVGPDGVPRHIRVQQTLRPDLDAKAMEAIEQWRFEPAMKDGAPVSVMIKEDVEFRLDSDNVKIRELQRLADAGDPKAQLELSEVYFQGIDVRKSDSLGCKLRRQAADRGLPEAQYEMGEDKSGKGSGPINYFDAYVWFSLAERGGYKGSAEKMKKIAKQLTRVDIADAQYKVKNWQPSK
jgi:TonB family protein